MNFKTISVFTYLTMISVFSAEAAKLKLVPTFENCGVYVEDTTAAPEKLSIRYRKQGTEKWLKGHELTNSPTKAVPRCSLFRLSADTGYEVQCLLDGKVVAAGKFHTWKEDVPVKKTIKISSNSPFQVKEYGTADGWVRYIPASDDVTIQGGYDNNEAILLDGAKYVIIEKFKIRGGKRHGIQLKKSHHIRIRNCDIAGFGRKGEEIRKGQYYEPGAKKPNNWDAGVYLDQSEQLVIENCYIHDPRGKANSWRYGHPAGPNGIFIYSGPKGQLVIRYNDIVGSFDKRWNDSIESYANGKPHGGPRYNSDIYGNYLAFSNDDGIELEGGMENIRFYGNKVEGSMCGISTAANLVGPAYIFNNLVAILGDGRGKASAVVKNGGGTTYSKGLTYFYNNTFFTAGRGITGVGYGRDKNRRLFNGISRNNILAVSSSGISDLNSNSRCSYDYDLFANVYGGNGTYDTVGNMESHAVFGNPGFVNPAKGDFRLKPDSPAVKAGTTINGLYPDNRNDMGALPRDCKYTSLPWRKINISTDKTQVRIIASRNSIQSVSREVTINTQKLNREIGYKILKNSDSTWFKVTPDQGVLKPGAELKLKVSLNGSSINHDYLAGTFIVKLASGGSIPVSIYLSVVDADYAKFYKAVDCEGANQFKRVVVDGKECLDFSGKKDCGITIKPNVPIAGNYYLYYNVKCPRPFPLHDSIFVGINGEPLETCAVTGNSNWHWNRKIGKVGYIKLNKGQNIIKIAQREEIFLSGIYISSYPLFPGDEIKE